MSKKITHQTILSALITASNPIAEAEKRIAEARRKNDTKLDLSYLGLTEVPAALFELRELRELDLSQNQLREVPAALCRLRRLQQLNLERVVNFSTVSAMIYVRPLPLLDLVNFLDGTKSLSK